MADGLINMEVEEFVDDRPMPLAVPMSKYWMMDDGYFFTTLDALLSMSVTDASAMAETGRLRMEQEANAVASGEKKPYVITDGVAYINMVGPMTKRPNCMAEIFGGGGVSTIRTRQHLRAAIKDGDVKSIMLVVESPGGEVNGAFDLAADVAKANKIKPVAAYIEDVGASAAYLVASQAGVIYANSNAVSGSIGVYQELHDTSRAAAFRGTKVHVIKAGEHKAIGAPGTEITDDQLAVVQKNVNRVHGLFLRAVNTGRGMDAKALARVADGGIFIGADGKRAGLIDNITTIDQAHAELVSTKKRRNIRGNQVMATTETEVQQMLDTAEQDEMPVLDEDENEPATTQPATPPVVEPAAAAVPPTPLASLNSALVMALNDAGISTAEQISHMRQMAAVGEDYTAALKKQVTQLAVVAFGPTDGPVMSAGVQGATIEQLKAFNRQFSGIAQAKGLIGADGNRGIRQTAAQEIAGGVQQNDEGVSSENNEGRVAATTNVMAPVDSNRNNFNATGLYSL